MRDPLLVELQPESPPTDATVDRLAHLEHENQRLRRFGWVVLVAAVVVLGVTSAVVVLFGTHRLPPPGAVVQARSFVLQDAKGKVRGTWGVTEEGAVQLALADESGQPRVRMSVLEDGSPGLALVDGDGRPRAALGLLADGTINLVFADEDGRGRAVLGLTAGGASSLVLADGRGVTRAGLSVVPGGRATLTVDEAGGGP